MRRALDIAICLLAAPLLLAVGALIALCVFLDSPGPVLYRSRRVGRGGRVFSMLKFRTMRHGVEGPPLSVFGDERYTPFGRALAISRLDELPQVVNVLRGEMRLVGPRPELPEFVDAHADSYTTILTAPPGLTGPAQLYFSGEGRLLASQPDRVATYRSAILPEKVSIDLDYVRTATLRRDISLLCLTLLLPARLGADAYRAWRGVHIAARPAAATVAVVATSFAVTCVFAAEVATSL